MPCFFIRWLQVINLTKNQIYCFTTIVIRVIALRYLLLEDLFGLELLQTQRADLLLKF